MPVIFNAALILSYCKFIIPSNLLRKAAKTGDQIHKLFTT